MTKEELITQMKHHRSEYDKLSGEWVLLMREEKLARHIEEQKKTLEEYKAKYKFFADAASGEVKEIDWAEVEKLITTSFDGIDGYSLGFDPHGQSGLGVSYPGGGGFNAMVEDEIEAKRYAEREARMSEYRARSKTKSS